MFFSTFYWLFSSSGLYKYISYLVVRVFWKQVGELMIGSLVLQSNRPIITQLRQTAMFQTSRGGGYVA